MKSGILTSLCDETGNAAAVHGHSLLITRQFSFLYTLLANLIIQ
jgi:hypothetical protein